MIQGQPIQKQPLIIMQLCLMVLIGRFAFDIYVPALPTISDQFQSNTNQISLTMSLFSLGFGLSQLFYGPLSDRFGRRLIVLFGFLIFIAGTIWASFVDSIIQLCWARFVVGCGAGVGVVISRAIARDLFVSDTLAKVFAIQSLILTLGLFIAPVAGSYLLHWFGWRSQFLTLTAFGIMCLVLFLYHLPETNQFSKPNHSVKNILKQYLALTQDRIFIVHAMIVGLSFAGLVAYFQLSSFIYQSDFDISAINYGWLSLVIVIAYVIGTISLQRDLKTRSLYQIVNKGSLYMITASAILLIAYYFQLTPLSIILFTTMLYVYGLRLIMPSGTSICLSNCEKNAGTAAALLGAIIMLISAFMSCMIGLFKVDAILMLGFCYLFLGGTSCLVLMISPKPPS